MTNESDTYAQAEPGKAPGSTFERKEMSFKTLRKRIALVAVAALAVTGLSTVPANAAERPASEAINITLANATSTATVGSTVYVNFMARMTAMTDLTVGGGDVVTFSSGLVSFPAGGFVQVTANANATGLDGAALTDTEIYTTGTGGNAGTIGDAGTSGSTFQVSLTQDGSDDYDPVTTAASASVAAATFTFTPTVAGDYALRVWHDPATAGTLNYNEMFSEIKITVAARAGASPSLSTVLQADAIHGTAFEPTVATTARIYHPTYPAPTLCSTTIATQCANLLVTVRDSANRAISTGWVFGAEISGSGNLGISDTDGNFTQGASARAVSLATPANNVFNVSIFPDGLAGVGTVTVYAQNATTGERTNLATRTVTFYGTLAKLEVTSQSYKIIQAGKGTATGIITALTETSDTPAVVIKATDSGGRLVPGLSITATSSDLTVVSGSSVNPASAANNADYSYGHLGNYVANVTPATSSTSGKTAKVTYSVTLSTGAVISTTADFSIGGGIATEVISFDKATYAPGDPINLTITAKDSAGNPVYDGAASPQVSFSRAMGGTSPMPASTYLAGKKSSTSSKGVPSLYAPSTSGAVTATATSGNAAGTVITASTNVASAIDATIASLVAAIAKLQKAINKINKRLAR